MPFELIQLMGLDVDVTVVPWQFDDAVTSYAITVLLAGTVALHVPDWSVVQETSGVNVTTSDVPAFLKMNVICINGSNSRAA
jgi:hypothetical protein